MSQPIKKSLSDKEIDDFTNQIESNPNDIEALVNRAKVYAGKEMYDKSIADCDKAIAINADYAYAYLIRGNAYIAKDEYDKAITDYSKSIELYPDDPDAYNNRGIAKKMLRVHKGEKQDFQTALKLADQQGNIMLAISIQQRIADSPADPD